MQRDSLFGRFTPVILLYVIACRIPPLFIFQVGTILLFLSQYSYLINTYLN